VAEGRRSRAEARLLLRFITSPLVEDIEVPDEFDAITARTVAEVEADVKGSTFGKGAVGMSYETSGG